jgi:hypothetical protein
MPVAKITGIGTEGEIGRAAGMIVALRLDDAREAIDAGRARKVERVQVGDSTGPEAEPVPGVDFRVHAPKTIAVVRAGKVATAGLCAKPCRT